MALLLKENDVSLVNLYAVMRYLCWEKQSWAGLKMLYNLSCAAPFFNLNIGMIAHRQSPHSCLRLCFVFTFHSTGMGIIIFTDT